MSSSDLAEQPPAERNVDMEDGVVVEEAAPFIEVSRRNRAELFQQRRETAIKWSLYAMGIAVILFTAPPSFGSSWVVAATYKLNTLLAAFLGLLVTFGRLATLGFFVMPLMLAWAVYLANSNREPITRELILKKLLYTLLGFPEAVFFGLFQFKICDEFAVNVYANKENLWAFFINLANAAENDALRVATALAAFIANIFGNLTFFDYVQTFFWEVFEDFRLFPSYDFRQRTRFFTRNGMGALFLGLSMAGISESFFKDTVYTFSRYFGFPQKASEVLGGYMVIFMGLVMFLLTGGLGRRAGDGVWGIFARDFSDWPPETRQRVLNFILGVITTGLAVVASGQYVFMAIVSGGGVAAQILAAIANTTSEWGPLALIVFAMAAAAGTGISYCRQSCCAPALLQPQQVEDNHSRSWRESLREAGSTAWGRTGNFFRSVRTCIRNNWCCVGNRGKPQKEDIDIEESNPVEASIDREAATVMEM